MEIAKLVLEFLQVLAWPAIVVFLSIFFRTSLEAILARMVKATLPGGVAFDFDKKIEKIEELSEQASATPAPKQLEAPRPIEAVDANTKLVELGLTPVQSGLKVSYFETLADQDPILAIAALRIEMEILANNLFVACNLPTPPLKTASMLIRRLSEGKLLNEYQSSLSLEVIKLCNLVVHGKKISRESADKVFKAVAVLYLDYIAWLSTK